MSKLVKDLLWALAVRGREQLWERARDRDGEIVSGTFVMRLRDTVRLRLYNDDVEARLVVLGVDGRVAEEFEAYDGHPEYAGLRELWRQAKLAVESRGHREHAILEIIDGRKES